MSRHPPPSVHLVVDSLTTLRPHHGGFFEAATPGLGERMEAGDGLGRILNPYTFEGLQEMHNPVPGGVTMLSYLTRNRVQREDEGDRVGNPV